MKNEIRTDEQGYALLIGVILIASFMLMLAVVSARRVQDGYFSNIDLTQVIHAQALAEGCAEVALLRWSTQAPYPGNETIQMTEGSCTILPIQGNAIDVEALSEGRSFHIRFLVSNDDPPVITSWQRIP